MKNILNFILSILTLIYVTIMALILVPIIDITSIIGLPILIEINRYGPLVLLSSFALVNFADKSYKLIFFILMAIVFIAIVLVWIDPNIFGSIV
ncbi:MAG: hypothetical protein PHX09_00035 [Clostridia bacterium]|nr:hypothetical protein [Clostridia bacterium]MDD4686241.1 hypothetical protein [Clostridia bacterium]